MNATQTPRAPHNHAETLGSDVNPDQQQKAPPPENTPPLVYHLAAWRIPRPVAAACVILCLLGFLSTAIYALSEPAARWIETAPQNLHQVEDKLKARLQEPLAALEQAYGRLAQITGLETAAPPRPFEIQRPSLIRMLISGTPEVIDGIGGVAVIFALLFFLLASPRLTRKVLYLIPNLNNKRRADRIGGTPLRSAGRSAGAWNAPALAPARYTTPRTSRASRPTAATANSWSSPGTSTA